MRCHPSASAGGSRGGTMTPHSPRISAESPLSVATHGTPQAIASASTLGKPSPKAELKVAMSSAG